MSGDVVYLDTSAAVKILVPEPQSAALKSWLRRRKRRASAALLEVELLRTVRRAGLPGLLARSRELLSDVHLIRLDAALLASAAQIEPLELRSLDAIHLAAAAGLGMQLEAVLSYDVRMLGAAVALGLPTASPA